ncbi:MAG: sporulation transcription factor Spo0A [Christensenellales bacterium]|jgi:two-component system response regulator (stage 0 sporulation protein A)
MGRISMLVVDGDPDFRSMLRDYFYGDDVFEIVGEAGSGTEALEAIREHSPDIVILDTVLPGLDGIGVMKELSRMACALPRIVVFSSSGQEELIRRVSELGARSIFLKPFRMDVFRRRLERIMAVSGGGGKAAPPGEARANRPDGLEQEISLLLHRMAIPPHIKGYRYLRESVAMVVRDMSLINRMTFDIYPIVADIYGTTPSRVERAMRHAIEVAWNRCRVETIEQIFGYTVSANKDKPSNGEFIAMIADNIRLKLRMV